MKINNFKGVILLGAVLSIGFSSCQVVNKYKSPELETEDLYRDQRSQDTTTIASIPWQEYFQDPILINLIQEGLENNHDLLSAEQTIKQAEAGLSMARAAYFPDVALVAKADHSRYSMGPKGKDVLGYHGTDYTLGISASWEADIWGKLNRQSRASYAQFLSSHAYKNLIQTSLISNIATSYYTLVALDEQLVITKETVGLLNESTETMIALKDAGMLNGAAVEQSKGLLYGTKVSVPTLESSIKELENTISLLIGRKPGYVERSNIVQQNIPKEMHIGVPMQMLSLRPDVMQAELAFRSAFELKTAAQASFYPSITLGATLAFNHNKMSHFFKPENLIANIVGGLTQPLFARKQLITNLKVNKSKEQEAYIRFQQSVLNASKEVSDIVDGFEASLRKNDDRNKQVQALSTAVTFTQELLKAGEANYTEVLNAEQNLLQAQLGQVNDKLEQLQYSVSLYRALGGGVNYGEPNKDNAKRQIQVEENNDDKK